MGRTVTAVVTSGDRCVGAVGPFAVDVPWWAEVEQVSQQLSGELGVSAYVLRLLSVEDGGSMRDGHVTYHVEAAGTAASLRPATLDTADDPLRSHWATAKGLRDLFTWAREAVTVTGPIQQRKTWNLAGLFRLPTPDGPVWLKALPPFATDEAAVMAAFAAVDPGLVPTVIASGPGRLLLADIPGEDCWHAPEAVLANGIRRFVAAQSAIDTCPGLREWSYVEEVAALLERDLGLTAAEVSAARALLPRWSALDDCGLPTTIVHGDFHSGNWRSDAGGPPRMLDFADAHLGNPVLDGLRVVDYLAPERKTVARSAWVSAWQAVRPASDPARALAVAEPLAHLYYAVRYQEFLDGIEESERIYHLDDPASAVRAALASA